MRVVSIVHLFLGKKLKKLKLSPNIKIIVLGIICSLFFLLKIYIMEKESIDRPLRATLSVWFWIYLQWPCPLPLFSLFLSCCFWAATFGQWACSPQPIRACRVQRRENVGTRSHLRLCPVLSVCVCMYVCMSVWAMAELSFTQTEQRPQWTEKRKRRVCQQQITYNLAMWHLLFQFLW